MSTWIYVIALTSPYKVVILVSNFDIDRKRYFYWNAIPKATFILTNTFLFAFAVSEI